MYWPLIFRRWSVCSFHCLVDFITNRTLTTIQVLMFLACFNVSSLILDRNCHNNFACIFMLGPTEAYYELKFSPKSTIPFSFISQNFRVWPNFEQYQIFPSKVTHKSKIVQLLKNGYIRRSSTRLRKNLNKWVFIPNNFNSAFFDLFLLIFKHFSEDKNTLSLKK